MGFAMLQLRRADEAEVGCEDYESLALRANGDGRLYAVSLRNSVPLAPNIAHARPSGNRARWSWLCYALQADGTSTPTRQK